MTPLTLRVAGGGAQNPPPHPAWGYSQPRCRRGCLLLPDPRAASPGQTVAQALPPPTPERALPGPHRKSARPPPGKRSGAALARDLLSAGADADFNPWLKSHH